MPEETITLTFGEAGENHIGMEMIGQQGSIGTGFNHQDLQDIQKKFEDSGYTTELVHLNQLYLSQSDNVPAQFLNLDTEAAYVLVIRNGIDYFLRDNNTTTQNFYHEMLEFEWDRKYWDVRRQKVLNKHARANVCFDKEGQEPDYQNCKGRVIAYDKVPILNSIRDKLPEALGEKGNNLICEGNRYFDINKCGIGWHGDAERKKVIAFRIGATIPLKYQWFYQSKPVGGIIEFQLGDGDMYIMSEKATGYDWKKRTKSTLRHCAGCNKYTKPKPN